MNQKFSVTGHIGLWTHELAESTCHMSHLVNLRLKRYSSDDSDVPQSNLLDWHSALNSYQCPWTGSQPWIHRSQHSDDYRPESKIKPIIKVDILMKLRLLLSQSLGGYVSVVLLPFEVTVYIVFIVIQDTDHQVHRLLCGWVFRCLYHFHFHLP